MLQYKDFNHKGVLIQIDDVPDALTDIRANTPFEWQDTADDRLVFVCIEREIVEVFDTTGKLADNDIRTAYIGEGVDEEFDGYPILRYMSYVEFDPKDKVFMPSNRRALVAKGIIETAKCLVDGYYCEYALADIRSDSKDYYNIIYGMRDVREDLEDECIEQSIDSIFHELGIYRIFLSKDMEKLRFAYRKDMERRYFAFYRLDIMLSDFYDDSEMELTKEELEDIIIVAISFQEFYWDILALYSGRTMLEQGAFVLLRNDKYRLAFDRSFDYMVYAIDKFAQTAKRIYVNNDRYHDNLLEQFNYIKAYFIGEDEVDDDEYYELYGDEYEEDNSEYQEPYLWLDDVSDEPEAIVDALQRLSNQLTSNGYEKPPSPMEQLEQTLEEWVASSEHNNLFDHERGKHL